MVQSHDHEFGEPEDIEIDEVIAIYQYCGFADIIGEYHSERHDEYFYEEGDSCDAVRVSYFELDRIVKDVEGGPVPIRRDTAFSETVEIKAIENLKELAAGPVPDPREFDPRGDEIIATVSDLAGDFDYQVIFTKSDVETHEM